MTDHKHNFSEFRLICVLLGRNLVCKPKIIKFVFYCEIIQLILSGYNMNNGPVAVPTLVCVTYSCKLFLLIKYDDADTEDL